MTAITREALDAALTTPERERRAELESTIDRGMRAFNQVGLALAEIRDARLYRSSHESFEAYLEDRWKMSRPRAYQLMQAAEVVSTVVDTGLPAPTNERQARALAAAPVELQPEAWRVASEDGERQPTAAQVTEAIATVTGKAAGPLPFEEGYDAFPFDLDDDEEPASAFDSDEGMAAWAESSKKPAPEPEKKADPLADTPATSSYEYYTPEFITEGAHRVMGGIDLDPASCDLAQLTVGAAQYYTLADDGLSERNAWAKRLFLNPPYGTVRGKSRAQMWINRLMRELEAGTVTEAIVVVNALTHAVWFPPLFGGLQCWLGRVAFNEPTGANGSGLEAADDPRNGTVVIYFGPNRDRFYREFRPFGRVTHEYEPQEVANE